MEDCDTILIVGSSFPYIEFLPKPGQARGVRIELDPARVGLRFPVEVGLVGDCRRSLQALSPYLKTNSKRSFLAEAQAGRKDWNNGQTFGGPRNCESHPATLRRRVLRA